MPPVVRFFKVRMKLSAYCDGGSRGNPGPAAIGFVVYKDGKKVRAASKRIGETTNNVAEYQAVVGALKWIGENLKPKEQDLVVNVFLDSELVSKQLRGIYKVKDVKLKRLIIQVKNLERQIGGSTLYYFIKRSQNKMADWLVNQALEEKS